MKITQKKETRINISEEELNAFIENYIREKITMFVDQIVDENYKVTIYHNADPYQGCNVTISQIIND